MKTATMPSPDRPGDQQTRRWTERSGREQALSDRELVALAERNAAVGDQDGLDAIRAEAERRAHDQAPDSLSAQIAGYIGLLAEDSDHALADEAHAWSRELREVLGPASAAVPAPRQVSDWAVRS